MHSPHSLTPVRYVSWGAQVARRAGFSLLEILLVVVIILTLCSLLVASLGRARSATTKTICLTNLRSISQAFAFYTVDNAGSYPNPAASNTSWEAAISSYLPPPSSTNSPVFRCAADQEIYANVGSSYDWRDTGVTNTTLAGRNVSTLQRDNAILAFDMLPGWHEPKMMNVVLITGSASSVCQKEWFADFSSPLGP